MERKRSAAIIVPAITILAAIVTILSPYLDWKKDKREHSSRNLVISFLDNPVQNNEERNIFICLSNASDNFPNISIAPTFDNTSEYPIKDFDLRYQFETKGFIPNPNALYDKIQYDNNGCIFKYQETRLPQFTKIHDPFRFSDFPKQNSWYRIVAKASIPGISHPFQYTVNVWVRIVSRSAYQSFENWKNSCKKTLSQLKTDNVLYDVYYISQSDINHEYGADLGRMLADGQSQGASSTYGLSQTPTPISRQVTTVSHTTTQTTLSNPQLNPSKTHNTEQQTQSAQTSISHASQIEIVSYERVEKDNVSYMHLTFSKPTTRGTPYFVVVHYKSSKDNVYTLYGSGDTTLDLRLADLENIDYVGVPVLDDSYKSHIKFYESDEGLSFVRNESNQPLMVRIDWKDGSSWNVTIDAQGTMGLRDVNISDIQSYATYVINRPKSRMEKFTIGFNIFVWALGGILIISCIVIIIFYIVRMRKKNYTLKDAFEHDESIYPFLCAIAIIVLPYLITGLIDALCMTSLTIYLFYAMIILCGVGILISGIKNVKKGNIDTGIWFLVIGMVLVVGMIISVVLEL